MMMGQENLFQVKKEFKGIYADLTKKFITGRSARVIRTEHVAFLFTTTNCLSFNKILYSSRHFILLCNFEIESKVVL